MTRWLRISAGLTLVALAMMVWSVLQPTPLPVMLAMSFGQVVGTAAFAIYGWVVFVDLRRLRRAARRDAAKVEAATVEPATVEAATVEPAKVEAATVEPAKVEAATVEAATVEAATVEAPGAPREPAEPT